MFRGSKLNYIILLVLVATACKKERSTVVLSDLNQWIMDSMKVYYYWNEKIPTDAVDQNTPTAFFNTLLSKEDRFSYIYDPDQLNTEYSSFAWYGFEYELLEMPYQSGGLTGIITLVVPGGPADLKGLKRGDYFLFVNNIPLTFSNIETVVHSIRSGNTLLLTTGIWQNNEWLTDKNIEINSHRFSEPAVYISNVFENGYTKAGYLFYNTFNASADQQLLSVISLLKQQNVNELILDMRYNPGGDVSSAAKLAAILCNVEGNDLFVIYRANKNGGERRSSFEQTIRENNNSTASFSSLLPYRLHLKRVIILVSERTASAAELLINNMKPYIDVIVIGNSTMGKDMASFAINDQRIPQQYFVVMHPLVFKLYNASYQGDYSRGIYPDYSIDEITDLPLKQFGNTDDVLLKKALEITGVVTINQKHPLRKNIELQKTSSVYIQELQKHSRRKVVPVAVKTIIP
ncbi:S41 family peptidase [Gynurincola endophyticus]|uniref:S41 family peptidase n=1 Tax=Gynurincola endophyticus TaxID=2479004 RepID=UPI001315A22D|nr:S41 family peptidase [Gynurincola endophyticus]